MSRIFLLSPANAAGRRTQLLLRPQADFELARRVRAGSASLGEIFSFASGLYFRGKLAYASAFAAPAAGGLGIQVITSDRGLLPAHTLVEPADLQAFAEVPIELGEPRYAEPLRVSATELRERFPEEEVVLLGSIATGKYVDALLPLFGERLLFPRDFIGRGDMSRGALMLRCASARTELDYLPIAGAVLKGARPAKLPTKLAARRENSRN